MKPRYRVIDSGHKQEYMRTVTTYGNDVRLFKQSISKEILMEFMNLFSAPRFSNVRSGVNAGKYYLWEYHRKDGPAYIDNITGIIEFYVQGIRYTDTRMYASACGMSELNTALMVLKYGDTLPFVMNGNI